MIPFVAFSLPRSRSTWLSVFLSREGAVIHHDLGIECATPEEYAVRLRASGGSCETGAAFAWRKIRQLIPECRFLVVQRPVGDVIHSLESLGFVGQVDEVMQRNLFLREISALPGTLSINCDDLATFDTCQQVHKFCLGVPCDLDWFDKMQHTNVQVDLKWQMERLSQNRPTIEALKCAATI